MKNKEIEEFDKKQLEELLKRLKDINNFTGFKDGAFKYYLGKYEADLLLSYIEQLEKRNKQLYEGFMATQEELTDYATENEQLENNRDKAIEYIESHFIFNDKTGECYQTHTFDKDNVKKLYDILKGDRDEI